MKVVQASSPNKEHLPIKYTQNIQFNFEFLGLNQEVGLLRKNPLQKEEGFNNKCNGCLKFLIGLTSFYNFSINNIIV